MSSLESASVAAVRYLLAGLALSLVGLIVDVSGNLFAAFIVHLVALVSLGLAVALALAPPAATGWFAESIGGEFGRRLASGVAVVVLTTGTVGLVTLASAAALRLDPSLQFLQLLSALDIAWVVAAVVVGAWRGWGRTASLVAGSTIGGLCVLSIWNYLRVVGFGPEGGWVVDGGALMRLVIPFDMAAAVVAVAVFVAGTKRSLQSIEQFSAQS